jgi:hypothetical protein
MMKPTGLYPRVRTRSGSSAVVCQAGGVVLTQTVRKSGLDTALSAALAPWRKPRAVHDPGKILLDVALAVALGGDCLADVAMLRAEPGVFGPVASDPTVSRLIERLAGAGAKALAAIRSARAAVRKRVWSLAADHSPVGQDGQVILDIDAALVTSHSEKEDATATWKKTFGHHPLLAFIDHGPDGTGEPAAAMLRPGRAGANTASDHITVAQHALAQLPKQHRRGRRTLIRTDSAGGTHAFLGWLTRPGRWLSYSVGMTITDTIHAAVTRIPKRAWTPAYNADGHVRDGAWLAEITDMLDLTAWPKGMRLIVRAERPHPGAQLRFTDADGNRLTCFATNTAGGQLASLELRHRRRARCEDRIRTARQTGLRNLPLHTSAQNQIWLEIVQLALDLIAWMPMLALTGDARRWEIKKLRLRLFSTAARLIRSGRQRMLRFADHWPWTHILLAAHHRLELLPNPG